MSNTGRLERHEGLMNRMADRNGADLALAQQVGLFSPEEYGDAKVACTGCASAEACEGHLKAGAPGIPEYCRNGDTLKRLAGEMRVLGLSHY